LKANISKDSPFTDLRPSTDLDLPRPPHGSLGLRGAGERSGERKPSFGGFRGLYRLCRLCRRGQLAIGATYPGEWGRRKAGIPKHGQPKQSASHCRRGRGLAIGEDRNRRSGVEEGQGGKEGALLLGYQARKAGYNLGWAKKKSAAPFRGR